jgi:hypothetical protein
MSKTFIIVLAAIFAACAAFLFVSWYRGPHYNSAANACFNNLRQIDAAKQQWGLEHHASATNNPSWDDLRPYLAGGKILTCPNGGTYTIGRIEQPPTCSHPGDILP